MSAEDGKYSQDQIEEIRNFKAKLPEPKEDMLDFERRLGHKVKEVLKNYGGRRPRYDMDELIKQQKVIDNEKLEQLRNSIASGDSNVSEYERKLKDEIPLCHTPLDLLGLFKNIIKDNRLAGYIEHFDQEKYDEKKVGSRGRKIAAKLFLSQFTRDNGLRNRVAKVLELEEYL